MTAFEEEGFGPEPFGTDEEPQQQHVPRTRQHRSRRVASGVPARSSSSRSKDSTAIGGNETSSGRSKRTPASSNSSSRSIDSGGRSSDQRAHRGAGADRSSRRGRRAPAAGGAPAAPRRAKSEDFNDYDSEERHEMGYGDAGPDLGYGDASPDLGYGDATPDSKPALNAKPARSRRQRRCSIAEVTSSSIDSTPASIPEEPDYGSAAPADRERSRLQRNASGDFSAVGATASTISNIAIPMATPEEAPKRKNRRGSMFGAISRNVGSSKSEPEPEKNKKPGADRDRRRQGTLLDRVGAGDARGSRNGPMSSYSDRILSK